jgi:plasmid stability protein
LIAFFETQDSSKGYNVTSGGEGAPGRTHSEETKRKIRAAQQGRSLTKEHRQKLREAWLRRAPASEETRKKMSHAHKGVSMNFSPDALVRISAANKGKKRHPR